MSTETAIEWADYTWNLVWGCTKVSPGCDHCYIDRTPPFRMAGLKFDKPGTGGSIPLIFHDNRMYDPLRKRKPGKWFVNSLSDMFHKDIPDEFIARAFAVMRLADHHIFQLLTKRHGRMQALLSSDRFRQQVSDATTAIVTDPDAPISKLQRDSVARHPVPFTWPIPNLWLGVTTENQDTANRRIPSLLMTPAAVHFLSMEPLLGPVDLTRIEWTKGGGTHLDVVNGRHGIPDVWQAAGKHVDWVIVGGESGPGARPMHPDWARSLRDQCAASDVPFLFKQWGQWQNGSADRRTQRGEDHIVHRNGEHVLASQYADSEIVTGRSERRMGACFMSRVGKHAAGRALDGRTHDDYPVPATA